MTVSVHICLLLWTSSALAATYQVRGSSKQLIKQVNQANSGDTIIVYSGVYRVNLTLRVPLHLTGIGNPVLDGGGHGNVVRLSAPNITVKGFTIRNSGINLTTMDAGVFINQNANNARIVHNRITHDLFGIWIDGARMPEINDNVIRGISTLRSPDRGDGIHVWNVHHGSIAGNNIADSRDGIYIYLSDNIKLLNNTIHDLRYGIHYMYSNHNQVIGNKTYHTRSGYALMQSDHLIIENNTSMNDRNYGILMNYVTYSKINGNKIIATASSEGYVPGGKYVLGAQGKALFAYNCVFNKITDNLFADSGIGLHLTAGSEHNRVYNNSFIDNRIQVRYGNNRPEEWSWKKRGNYWSDYMGWDLNHDGIGDVPYIPNDDMDRLLWIYPKVRLLINSPAIETVRWAQRQFPVFADPKVRDSYPLMRPSVRMPKVNAGR